MSKEFNLNDLDEEYETHDSEQNTDFEELPDGKYQVSVDRVELMLSKSGDKRMFKWTLKVINGEFKNRLIWKYSMLEPGDSLGYFKRDLHTLGFVKTISEVPNNLEFFLDLIIQITKKTKDGADMASIYFNKLLGQPNDSTGYPHIPPKSEPPPVDSDLPF
ncbi:hypothetical protein CL634_02785 [bacterium]|nr:hypothetical protein [bacterium]